MPSRARSIDFARFEIGDPSTTRCASSSADQVTGGADARVEQHLTLFRRRDRQTRRLPSRRGCAAAAARQRARSTPASSSDAGAHVQRREVRSGQCSVVAVRDPLRVADCRDERHMVLGLELWHANVTPLAVIALRLAQRHDDRRFGVRLALGECHRDHIETETELEVVTLHGRTSRAAAQPHDSVEVKPGHDPFRADDPGPARPDRREPARFEHAPVVRELQQIVGALPCPFLADPRRARRARAMPAVSTPPGRMRSGRQVGGSDGSSRRPGHTTRRARRRKRHRLGRGGPAADRRPSRRSGADRRR